MISAIVYTSNSGYTAEYARLLGQATGLPVNDLRQVHTPQPDEEVIFLGWLMAAPWPLSADHGGQVPPDQKAAGGEGFSEPRPAADL